MRNVRCAGVAEMAKYLVLSSFTGQPIKRFAAKPSDQAAVVRNLAESAGGRLECYYRMFGQDEEMGIFGQPRLAHQGRGEPGRHQFGRLHALRERTN